MSDRTDPKTGWVMRRGVRPLTLTYHGQSVTTEMPGWYADGSDEGGHSAERLPRDLFLFLSLENGRASRATLEKGRVLVGPTVGRGPVGGARSVHGAWN
jgi:hypothetical protein